MDRVTFSRAERLCVIIGRAVIGVVLHRGVNVETKKGWLTYLSTLPSIATKIPCFYSTAVMARLLHGLTPSEAHFTSFPYFPFTRLRIQSDAAFCHCAIQAGYSSRNWPGLSMGAINDRLDSWSTMTTMLVGIVGVFDLGI